MSRFALSLILLALPVLAHAEAPDRYGPDRDGLRGSAPVMSHGALLTWSSKQRAEQRQQPQRQSQSQRPTLRGAAAPAPQQPWAAQASTTPQPEYLPERRLTAAELMPASISEGAPARAAPRQAPIGQAYAPQGAALQARRYSVGREFGVEPDRIVIPDPSILAYAPEVGAAVIAQQERDKASDPGPASPADLDMLEQRQQDAQRAEARQKTQADNRAKKNK